MASALWRRLSSLRVLGTFESRVLFFINPLIHLSIHPFSFCILPSTFRNLL